MAEFKLVLSRKDGKSFQKVVKDKEASALLKKRIKDKISGKDIGIEDYEFEITGGSDKCGFPMRKGILQKRQKITFKGKSVGFSGKDRNKNKRKGLRRKKTVCGERIDSGIVQINLKILKEGKERLGEEGAKPTKEEVKEKKTEKKEEAPVEEKKEEVKGEEVEKKPKEEEKPAKEVKEEAPKKEAAAEEEPKKGA